MNQLFKTGEYVLLSDCEAYDKKHGLEKGATMWMVARKMEGGEPDKNYMKDLGDNCVGINEGDAGLWSADSDPLVNKLTVQEALYRSENGLTLNELAKIPCAFEGGKEYVCVDGSEGVYTENSIYKTNGIGIVDDFDEGDLVSCCTTDESGAVKFKPLSKPQPKEWVPRVGDECEFFFSLSKSKGVVKYISDKYVIFDETDQGETHYFRNGTTFKPIDKERERVINKAKSVGFGKDVNEYLNNLYDTGMLKEGEL